MKLVKNCLFQRYSLEKGDDTIFGKAKVSKSGLVELKNVDRWFARDIENIFFKTMKIIIGKVLGSVWVRLRKGKLQGQRLQAKDVQSTTNVEKLLSSQIGYSDFKNLRTSTDYKAKPKCNVFAIIRQLKQPTFFITFSCAEQKWKPLVDCLTKLNPNMIQENQPNPVAYIRALVRSDPITTARYYVHRFKEMKKKIKRNKSILGELIDYFFVTEFQQRGSQHDHELLWIKNVPTFGISLCIDTYISTNKDELDEYLRFDKLQAFKNFVKSCQIMQGYHQDSRMEVRSIREVRVVSSLLMSYIVAVPEGNAIEDTVSLVDTVVCCNLQSLARLSKWLAAVRAMSQHYNSEKNALRSLSVSVMVKQKAILV
ncbi:hypothetical protein L7F22_061864 [Adiantum nelumboides]|nr:hypothetical protein [Adiantum nelumboides]